jgi:hypothetical protein
MGSRSRSTFRGEFRYVAKRRCGFRKGAPTRRASIARRSPRWGGARRFGGQNPGLQLRRRTIIGRVPIRRFPVASFVVNTAVDRSSPKSWGFPTLMATSRSGRRAGAPSDGAIRAWGIHWSETNASSAAAGHSQPPASRVDNATLPTNKRSRHSWISRRAARCTRFVCRQPTRRLSTIGRLCCMDAIPLRRLPAFAAYCLSLAVERIAETTDSD